MKVKQVYIVFALLTLTICSVGCATYKMKTETYQDQLQQGNYKEALGVMENNKFLNRNKNLLLYYLEKGKIAHLKEDYVLSNSLLNQADSLIEGNKSSWGRTLLGAVTNPENEDFRAEDFEKVAIHYVKALNYIQLNQNDEAIVEVRKINLQLQRINDQYPEGKKNRYTSDAFALTLQGLLYESIGDMNNAFIAYRNAVDLYLRNDGTYFGVHIPEELKQDLLRTAEFMGFTNEFLRYQDLLQISYVNRSKLEGGELILLWENGLVPYKDETYFAFSVLPGNKAGVATIFNEELNLVLPLPIDTGGDGEADFSDIDIFNVAFPKYMERVPFYTTCSIKTDTSEYRFHLTEDYRTIAFKTLKDRTLREIGKAALRLGTKKVSEYLMRDQNSDIGTLLGIFNAATEKADTRNWQTLPQSIYYARIPLKKGQNSIELEFHGTDNTSFIRNIQIDGEGNLQFRKVTTLNCQPTNCTYEGSPF